MTTIAILFWVAGIEGICAMWFVHDCPTWGDVWRKLRSPVEHPLIACDLFALLAVVPAIPRARLLKKPPAVG